MKNQNIGSTELKEMLILPSRTCS